MFAVLGLRFWVGADDPTPAPCAWDHSYASAQEILTAPFGTTEGHEREKKVDQASSAGYPNGATKLKTSMTLGAAIRILEPRVRACQEVLCSPVARIRTQSRPLFPFLGFRFPYNPLSTKKGTLFIPRLLLGLETKP